MRSIILMLPVAALLGAGCESSKDRWRIRVREVEQHNRAVADEFGRHYRLETTRNIDASPFKVGDVVQLLQPGSDSVSVTVTAVSPDGKLVTVLAVKHGPGYGRAEALSTAVVPESLIERRSYPTHRYRNLDTGAEISEAEYHAAKAESDKKKQEPPPYPG